ncbi:hypothetical protein [Chryseobacterium sp. RR2-3-20]|uniref:hypothetical protein n=1 Tax=Chryseobacterium sp. RR2-3-20 TaxID=2787626 RepID=UPI001AE089DC|nr:hypothetical protein [Chryseobacterium sp. RR2-3-20]
MEEEIFSLYPNLESFKSDYKSEYYGYYQHKYPESNFISYLEILIKFYSKEHLDRIRFINEHKDNTPDWVIERHEEEMWIESLEFNRNLAGEWNKILEYLYYQKSIEIGKRIEQEGYFKSLKTQNLKKTRMELSNPEKIAVLYKLGIEETLNKFPIKEDRYRFIHELIGGNYDNIKSTMINGVSNDNERVAQDFINSKTI